MGGRKRGWGVGGKVEEGERGGLGFLLGGRRRVLRERGRGGFLWDMNPAIDPLSLNTFVVKEHVGFFKAANNFDIYDAKTGALALECREEKLGPFAKLFRFTDYKRMTPFEIEIREPGGKTLIEVKRGVSFFLSEVKVFDGQGILLGSFKQKFLSIGGKFDVLSADGQALCSLKGKWTGWDFSFGSEGVEFARVTKQWSGFGKEFFTSADNYVLTIDPSLGADHPLRKLIIAAVMCIDMVLKE